MILPSPDILSKIILEYLELITREDWNSVWGLAIKGMLMLDIQFFVDNFVKIIMLNIYFQVFVG